MDERFPNLSGRLALRLAPLTTMQLQQRQQTGGRRLSIGVVLSGGQAPGRGMCGGSGYALLSVRIHSFHHHIVVPPQVVTMSSWVLLTTSMNIAPTANCMDF